VVFAVAVHFTAPLHAEDADEVTDPAPEVAGPLTIPDGQIEVVDWRALDGWANDDHEAAFAGFLGSCRALVNSAKSTRDDRAMHAALLDVCRRAFAVIPLDQAGARGFFEENFRPVRISRLGEKDGFVTGYYEPIVEGSRVPTPDYKTPIYRRPDDLIVADKRNKEASAANKPSVMRQIAKGKFVPYYERSEIEGGALDGRRDPIDAFFIQIQGSARIRLEDGPVLRLNYDANNGHPYTPIGRILIERKIFTKDDMSMDRLRQWMNANPDESRELRQKNKSFVFFRIAQLADHEEAAGAQGVPLMAGRSIAVDKALHVYGTPFFIEADLPIASEKSDTKVRRLMMSQDTGSAITGPARADIYFGAGEEAAHIGGRIRHNARFTMLIPRDIDPVDAGAQFPLPPRPPGSVEPPPLTAAMAPPPSRGLTPVALPIPRPSDAPKFLALSTPKEVDQKPVGKVEPRLAARPEAKSALVPATRLERKLPAFTDLPPGPCVPFAVFSELPPAPCAASAESAQATAIERQLSALTQHIRGSVTVDVVRLAHKNARATKSAMAEHGRDGASKSARRSPVVVPQQMARSRLRP
jgi:membrane-bound lytic murein transglycosylase A